MDVADYFSQNYLEESLILQFHFYTLKNRLDLVFNLADQALSEQLQDKKNSYREVHRLVFEGVKSYKRTNVGDIYKKQLSYNALTDKGSICIYGIENFRCDYGWHFKASFGAFGLISFQYLTLIFDHKILSLDRKLESNDLYREINTDQDINFLNPFK